MGSEMCIRDRFKVELFLGRNASLKERGGREKTKIILINTFEVLEYVPIRPIRPLELSTPSTLDLL